MTEQLLTLQREQYEQLTERIDEARAARHDLRHQLAVLKGYGASGDNDRLTAYLDELMGTAPVPMENAYCENHAVNAVVGHYLAIARHEGAAVSCCLHIRSHMGGIAQSDLCVLTGNLLENAVEACRRVPKDERFIKLGSMIQGGRLYLTVDNSFDGQINHAGDTYLSRKRDGAGIGIASIRAVCKKYGGSVEFEAKDGVWQASVKIMM